MKNAGIRLLPLAAVLVLAACASAARSDEAAVRYHSPQGPCEGRGELLHVGSVDVPSFPTTARITRVIMHRGVRSVCYTTPQSLQEAVERPTR